MNEDDNHEDGDLVKEVVTEVKDSGVRGQGGKGGQVPPRAIHPHCVAHILTCLVKFNDRFLQFTVLQMTTIKEKGV